MAVTETGENLIFLISQPRTGSTLLQRMIASHPAVHTTAEPWLMLPITYTLKQNRVQVEYNGELASTAIAEFLDALPEGDSLYKQGIAKMAAALYDRACQQTGRTHFLDKTPRYYLIIPELAEIFPEARFIFLYRNPLAVLASILEKNVKEHWVLLGRHRDDLLTAPAKLLEAAALLPDRAISVRYEKLVDQPTIELEKICRFIEIDYNESMIEYGAARTPTGSMGDTTQVNEHSSPVATRKSRWLRLADHPQTRHYALAYLEELGDDTIAGMGYNSDELKTQLLSQPARSRHSKPTWAELMNPDAAMHNRFYYLELALLEHKRITQAIRRRFPPKRR